MLLMKALRHLPSPFSSPSVTWPFQGSLQLHFTPCQLRTEEEGEKEMNKTHSCVNAGSLGWGRHPTRQVLLLGHSPLQSPPASLQSRGPACWGSRQTRVFSSDPDSIYDSGQKRDRFVGNNRYDLQSHHGDSSGLCVAFIW